MSSLNNVAPTAASGGRSKRLPEGFPQLLKDVTREILRNYPREEGGQKPPEDTEQWIYEFAANYLRHQHVQAARGSSGSHPAGEGEGDEDQQQHRQQEIANHLFSMFQDADEAGVGELHCIQLQDTLRTLLSELNLPEWVLNVLLEEADENENQKIQYKEFIPAVVPLLEQAVTSLSPLTVNEDDKDVLFLHGLSQLQFENALRGIFEHVDTENTGAIPRNHVSVVLREAGLGLTRQEINGIMGLSTDENLDYSSICDRAIDTCIGALQRLYTRNLLPHDTTHVANALIPFLGQFDEDESGRLPVDSVIQIIDGADLSLSNVQLHAVCGTSLVEEDGAVDYQQLVEQCADYIVTAIRLQTDRRTAEQLAQLREQEQFQQISGMNYDDFMEWLSDRAKSLGKDETSFIEISALKQLLSDELGLNEGTIQSVISIAKNATKAETEGDSSGDSIHVSALIDHAADVILARQELETLTSL